MRDNPLRFARFWLLQAISVAVIMLPVSYLLGSRGRSWLRALGDCRGGDLGWSGLVIEAVADAQKSAFKARDENREPVHHERPLEVLPPPQLLRRDARLVGAVRLLAVPFLDGAAFAVVIGPVFITLLLLFVSGIPAARAKRRRAKYGDDPAYREYKRAHEHFCVPLRLAGSGACSGPSARRGRDAATCPLARGARTALRAALERPRSAPVGQVGTRDTRPRPRPVRIESRHSWRGQAQWRGTGDAPGKNEAVTCGPTTGCDRPSMAATPCRTSGTGSRSRVRGVLSTTARNG